MRRKQIRPERTFKLRRASEGLPHATHAPFGRRVAREAWRGVVGDVGRHHDQYIVSSPRRRALLPVVCCQGRRIHRADEVHVDHGELEAGWRGVSRRGGGGERSVLKHACARDAGACDHDVDVVGGGRLESLLEGGDLRWPICHVRMDKVNSAS